MEYHIIIYSFSSSIFLQLLFSLVAHHRSWLAAALTPRPSSQGGWLLFSLVAHQKYPSLSQPLAHQHTLACSDAAPNSDPLVVAALTAPRRDSARPPVTLALRSWVLSTTGKFFPLYRYLKAAFPCSLPVVFLFLWLSFFLLIIFIPLFSFFLSLFLLFFPSLFFPVTFFFPPFPSPLYFLPFVYRYLDTILF